MASIGLALKSVLRRRAVLALVILPTTLLFSMQTLLIAVTARVRILNNAGNDTRSIRVGSVEGIAREFGFFTQADANKLARVPHVVGVAPFIGGNGYVDPSDPKALHLCITNRYYLDIWGDIDTTVSPQELERWDGVKNGAIITRALANKYHWKLGEPMVVMAALPNGKPIELHLVVSVISETYSAPNFVWIHREFYQLAAGREETAWVLWVLLDKPENRPEAMKLVKETMSYHPHVIWTLENSKAVLTAVSRLMQLAFTAAGVLSMFLILCIGATLLILSIEQRTAEFATLRVVGFRRGQLALAILVEGALLMLPGAVFAALAMYYQYGGSVPLAMASFNVVVTVGQALASVVVALMLGLLSAVVPAWRTFNTDVLGALR